MGKYYDPQKVTVAIEAGKAVRVYPLLGKQPLFNGG